MNIKANNSPTVSIVIDTYNYGQFVSQAIDSVLGQHFPRNEMEIIVVDDGSTDDTMQQVKRYKDEVKYIYKPNGGQASALNIGFNAARVEFIAILDSDDCWLPQKLEKTVAAFFRLGGDIIGHNLIMTDSSGSNALYFPYRNTGWIESYFPPTSGIAFRKHFLKILKPIPDQFRISADFFIIWMSRVARCRIFFDCEPLGIYRVHSDNLYLGQPTMERVQRQLDTFKNMLACLRDEVLLHGRGIDYGEVRSEVEDAKAHIETAIDALSIRIEKGFYNRLRRLFAIIMSRSQLNASVVKLMLVATLNDASYKKLKQTYYHLRYRRAKVLAEV